MGTFGSSLNFLVFYLTFNYFNLHYILAGIIGFVFPIPFVYFINSLWSFDLKSYNFKSLRIYFVINVITLACHTSILIFIKTVFDWQEEICQLSAIIGSAIINFTLLKLFLFNKK